MSKNFSRKAINLLISESEFRSGSDNMQGHCIACGSQQDGCEPDARKYTCESCGEKAVYGFEELLLMGMVELTDEDGNEDGEFEEDDQALNNRRPDRFSTDENP